MNSLISVSDAALLIRDGLSLSIAGEESCLDRLPTGRWVGGTIPYFMAPEGGLKTKDRVFVTQLPESGATSFAHYPTDRLEGLVANAPANGFSLAIVPAFSRAHARFAQDCRSYEDAFLKPTVGWIAGIDLDDFGKRTPKIYDGMTGRKYEDGAVVAYVSLPSSQLASIDIVNIFEPDGVDVLRFDKPGFSASACLVNGKSVKLAAYLAERGNAVGRLPLVGDFAGAHANVSFQSIDAQSGEVKLYAPVFPDVEYWLARPVGDYARTLNDKLHAMEDVQVAFSCNCILNYVYGELEGKKVGRLSGPMTFGEIGYQLLNQTFVALRID